MIDKKIYGGRGTKQILACISIINRGEYDKEDYVEYLKGIRSLTDHMPIQLETAGDDLLPCLIIFDLLCSTMTSAFHLLYCSQHHTAIRLIKSSGSSLLYGSRIVPLLTS